MKGIIEVIDVLGSLLKEQKNEIRFKNEEIENLKREVEEMESLISFYNHEISEDEYNEIVKSRKFNASNS